MHRIVWFFAYVLIATATQAQAPANVPVIKISPVGSTIQFAVKASVSLEGTFDKWDATLTFTSDHAVDGVLDIKIQAASVNTEIGRAHV